RTCTPSGLRREQWRPRQTMPGPAEPGSVKPDSRHLGCTKDLGQVLQTESVRTELIWIWRPMWTVDMIVRRGEGRAAAMDRRGPVVAADSALSAEERARQPPATRS